MTATPRPTLDTPLSALGPRPGLALYDTTLRDGTQREGVNLSVDDKLRVARHMDALGVHYVEGGWPGANPKDTEFFRRAADGELVLEHATLVAFGMTRLAGATVEDDALVGALADAGTDVVCLVGKSWGYHVDDALGVPRSENLAMVSESIAHLRGLGKRVFFDAEHFFDGHARDAAYATEVVMAAAEAGAEAVVLCDTNGGAMPWDVAEVVRHFVTALPCDVGLHFHDDGGCAVANSLLGLEVGATQVQGTANGLGERCGNANLFTVLADLQLKRGLPLLAPDRLERLTEVSHAVAEICNQATPSVQPYVGHTAFAHKAGLHASALAKAPDMYQHVEPGQVGNSQRLVVSELAGRSNIVLKAKELGIEIGGDQAATVLAEIKRRESGGWTYEAADASFELLLRRVTGLLTEGDEPFASQHYRVSVAGGAEPAVRPASTHGADRVAGGAEPAVRPASTHGADRVAGGAEAAVRPASTHGADRVAGGASTHGADPIAGGPDGPAEAILSVVVEGRRRLGAGEGTGPVDALDHAFRSAVNGMWPQLDRVHLLDYKVRILEASSGTDAVTRVLVTSTDGTDVWDTVGVHPNIVEASWLALSDAYTYAILRPGW